MKFVWKIRKREIEKLMKNSFPDSEIKHTGHHRYNDSVSYQYDLDQ